MPDARFVYIRLISDANTKMVIKPTSTQLKNIDSEKVVINTAKIICAWRKKILSFVIRKLIKMTT